MQLSSSSSSSPPPATCFRSRRDLPGEIFALFRALRGLRNRLINSSESVGRSGDLNKLFAEQNWQRTSAAGSRDRSVKKARSQSARRSADGVQRSMFQGEHVVGSSLESKKKEGRWDPVATRLLRCFAILLKADRGEFADGRIRTIDLKDTRKFAHCSVI